MIILMKKGWADVSMCDKYGISHFVSFKNQGIDDNLITKGGLGVDQVKIGSFLKELRKRKRADTGTVG